MQKTKIGIVTAWGECGMGYIAKNWVYTIEKYPELFDYKIFCRAVDKFTPFRWYGNNVTQGYESMDINNSIFWTWIDDYKPDVITPEGEEANSLYVEMPLCSIFVKGHKAGAALKPERRKHLLVQILESLHETEALLYMQMLKKKTKIKGLTSLLVLEVFPGLYKEGE